MKLHYFLLLLCPIGKGNTIPLPNNNIGDAIHLWTVNQTEAEELYGPIELWNTSQVTSMYSSANGCGAFQGTENFKANLSAWDISSVTSMKGIFRYSKNFTGDLSGWNTSQVRSLGSALARTENFHANLSAWDVSSVTDMEGIFFGSQNFEGDVSAWKISQVTSLYSAFWSTESFQADISGWNVSSVTNMSYIFADSKNFTGELCWDLSSVDTNTLTAFSCGTQGGFSCDCPSLNQKDVLGQPFCQIINRRCYADPTPPCVASKRTTFDFCATEAPTSNSATTSITGAGLLAFLGVAALV